MAKSKETFNKKQKETKRMQKRHTKESKKLERDNNRQKGAPLNEMLAYVDENGNLTSTPPEHGMLRHISSPAVTSVQNISENEPGQLHTGIVTFFNEEKGFGFIQDQRNKEKVFVHVSDLLDKIKEHENVSYEVERGKRGPSARKVKLSAR